jgi:hypothetical protein
MVLGVIALLTNPEGVSADISAWLEAGKKLEAASKAHDKWEAELLRREKEAQARETSLDVRAEEIAKAEQLLAARSQQLERQRAEFDALRADLRKAWEAP